MCGLDIAAAHLEVSRRIASIVRRASARAAVLPPSVVSRRAAASASYAPLILEKRSMYPLQRSPARTL
jgi:hypothetical protein